MKSPISQRIKVHFLNFPTAAPTLRCSQYFASTLPPQNAWQSNQKKTAILAIAIKPTFGIWQGKPMAKAWTKVCKHLILQNMWCTSFQFVPELQSATFPFLQAIKLSLCKLCTRKDQQRNHSTSPYRVVDLHHNFLYHPYSNHRKIKTPHKLSNCPPYPEGKMCQMQMEPFLATQSFKLV